jgi:hypothetical protein
MEAPHVATVEPATLEPAGRGMGRRGHASVLARAGAPGNHRSCACDRGCWLRLDPGATRLIILRGDGAYGRGLGLGTLPRRGVGHRRDRSRRVGSSDHSRRSRGGPTNRLGLAKHGRRGLGPQIQDRGTLVQHVEHVVGLRRSGRRYPAVAPRPRLPSWTPATPTEAVAVDVLRYVSVVPLFVVSSSRRSLSARKARRRCR